MQTSFKNLVSDITKNIVSKFGICVTQERFAELVDLIVIQQCSDDAVIDVVPPPPAQVVESVLVPDVVVSKKAAPKKRVSKKAAAAATTTTAAVVTAAAVLPPQAHHDGISGCGSAADGDEADENTSASIAAAASSERIVSYIDETLVDMPALDDSVDSVPDAPIEEKAAKKVAKKEKVVGAAPKKAAAAAIDTTMDVEAAIALIDAAKASGSNAVDVCVRLSTRGKHKDRVCGGVVVNAGIENVFETCCKKCQTLTGPNPLISLHGKRRAKAVLGTVAVDSSADTAVAATGKKPRAARKPRSKKVSEKEFLENAKSDDAEADAEEFPDTHPSATQLLASQEVAEAEAGEVAEAEAGEVAEAEAGDDDSVPEGMIKVGPGVFILEKHNNEKYCEYSIVISRCGDDKTLRVVGRTNESVYPVDILHERVEIDEIDEIDGSEEELDDITAAGVTTFCYKGEGEWCDIN